MIITKLRLLIIVIIFGTAIQLVNIRYRSSTSSQSLRAPAVSVPTRTVGTSTTEATPGVSIPAWNSTGLCAGRKGNTFSVDAAGSLRERLQRFNAAIDCARSAVLPYVQDITDTRRLGTSAIFINDDDYVQALSKYQHVATVALPWRHASNDSEERDANLLVQQYFPWTGTARLCEWLRYSTRLPKLYTQVFTKMACNEDLKNVLRPVPSLRYGLLKANPGKWLTKDFYRKPPSSVAVLHVLAGGNFVTGVGQVISGRARLVIDYCFRNHHRLSLSSRAVLSAPYVDEMFAIQHPAGDAVYHNIVEEIPRLAPFVEFLRRRPEVLVHASARKRVRYFLRVLGLDPERAISGPVRAGVVYMPRPPTCMMPRAIETQLMTRYCRDFARFKFGQRPRNRLVLIIRSGKRKFVEHNAVVKTVRAAAAAYRLRYTEFRDDPLPSFGRTVTMFYEAVMIVAAHGAGLSNILFCQAPTFVIEIVPNSYVTPLCYLQLAHSLGHHWHGIGADRVGWGLSRVNITTLQRVIHANLQLWKKQGKEATRTN